MNLLASLQGSAFGVWVRESPSLWAYPTVLTAHTIGLGILVGGNVALDLAVLGVFPGLPVAPLERLYPIMWLGFWINALSGVSLFVADAVAKSHQPVFIIKMAFIAGGIGLMLRMRRTLFGARVDEAASGKRLAALSLVCWAGAITAGRLMAYFA
jgi:hypothetical protein